MELNAALLPARIAHTRQRPRRHAFTYRAGYLCFDLADRARLPGGLLSLNRFNLFSFYDRDHGARDGSALEPWLRAILRDHGLHEADGAVTLVALPRLLGHVFNPVSFWFCFDRNGGLRAVLSEVCNTFGERHCYLSCHDDHRVIAPADWLRADKVFHVSPFLPVEGHYLFRFACEAGRIAVQVNYHDSDGLMLATSIAGRRVALTSAALLRHALMLPLSGLKIMALIHLEAIRLLWKGAVFRRKPAPPTLKVSR